VSTTTKNKLLLKQLPS